jgi:hypothetical protein
MSAVSGHDGGPMTTLRSMSYDEAMWKDDIR